MQRQGHVTHSLMNLNFHYLLGVLSRLGDVNLKQRGFLLLGDSWNSVSWGMLQVSGCAFWSGAGSCYWSETLQDHPMQERILSLSFDLVSNILETGPVSVRCPLWKCWNVYRTKLLRHSLYRASYKNEWSFISQACCSLNEDTVY